MPDLRLPSLPWDITARRYQLYCFVTEVHVCEQLVQGRYLAAVERNMTLSLVHVQISRHSRCVYWNTVGMMIYNDAACFPSSVHIIY